MANDKGLVNASSLKFGSWLRTPPYSRNRGMNDRSGGVDSNKNEETGIKKDSVAADNAVPEKSGDEVPLEVREMDAKRGNREVLGEVSGTGCSGVVVSGVESSGVLFAGAGPSGVMCSGPLGLQAAGEFAAGYFHFAGLQAAGAFWGTRVMEIVKKHDSGGLVWKRIKLTPTRKANAKKRLRRVWQNEAVLRECSKDPLPETSVTGADGGEKVGGSSQ
ncbi:hypothetical protein ACOSQ3_019008 [Xanthoceras sorbifolium]